MEGLYRPLWSTAILEELGFQQARKLVGRGISDDVATQRARHLIDRRLAFDDAVVVDGESLEGSSVFRIPMTLRWWRCALAELYVPGMTSFGDSSVAELLGGISGARPSCSGVAAAHSRPAGSHTPRRQVRKCVATCPAAEAAGADLSGHHTAVPALSGDAVAGARGRRRLIRVMR